MPALSPDEEDPPAFFRFLNFWHRHSVHPGWRRRALSAVLLGVLPWCWCAPGFGATFPSDIYHIRPEGDVAKLVANAGFEAVELRRHARGALQLSFVIGTRAQDKPA